MIAVSVRLLALPSSAARFAVSLRAAKKPAFPGASDEVVHKQLRLLVGGGRGEIDPELVFSAT